MRAPLGQEKSAYVPRTEQLCRERRFEEAIAAARAGLDDEGDDPAGRWVLARALYGAGRDAEARAELERLVETVGRNAAVWRLLGRIHFENGRDSEAAAALARVLEREPDDPYARTILSLIRGECAPADSLASETIAGLYLEQGHKTHALEILCRVAAGRPADRGLKLKISSLAAGEG